eukprot:TRINITY_DN8114_c0_g3_i6.p3 TRINITY_DN8114_c0_g3~~TRINITY_DN8114_c0_g3_i6.p3  ORF type:complete len:133 (-),score=5.52 TRINITY_DN8114_c0_g3_i6:577-975(-)
MKNFVKKYKFGYIKNFRQNRQIRLNKRFVVKNRVVFNKILVITNPRYQSVVTKLYYIILQNLQILYEKLKVKQSKYEQSSQNINTQKSKQTEPTETYTKAQPQKNYYTMQKKKKPPTKIKPTLPINVQSHLF